MFQMVIKQQAQTLQKWLAAFPAHLVSEITLFHSLLQVDYSGVMLAIVNEDVGGYFKHSLS